MPYYEMDAWRTLTQLRGSPGAIKLRVLAAGLIVTDSAVDRMVVALHRGTDRVRQKTEAEN